MLTSACQDSSYGDTVVIHGQDGCVSVYTEGCVRMRAHCAICVHACMYMRAVVSMLLWVYTLWRAVC